MIEGPHYETFEHTADIGLYLYGRSLSELFEAAVKAVLELSAGGEGVEARQSRRMDLSAESTEALLRAWLAEIVYLMNVERWLTVRVEIKEFSPTALSAVLEGERLDPARHELALEIKAVTWHRLKIEPDQRPGWFRATVVLDV